jgi:hypothetical protein
VQELRIGLASTVRRLASCPTWGCLQERAPDSQRHGPAQSVQKSPLLLLLLLLLQGATCASAYLRGGVVMPSQPPLLRADRGTLPMGRMYPGVLFSCGRGWAFRLILVPGNKDSAMQQQHRSAQVSTSFTHEHSDNHSRLLQLVVTSIGRSCPPVPAA